MKKGVKLYPIYSDNFRGVQRAAKLLGDYRILSLWTGDAKKEIQNARISEAIRKNLPLNEEDQQALITRINLGNE